MDFWFAAIHPAEVRGECLHVSLLRHIHSLWIILHHEPLHRRHHRTIQHAEEEGRSAHINYYNLYSCSDDDSCNIYNLHSTYHQHRIENRMSELLPVSNSRKIENFQFIIKYNNCHIWNLEEFICEKYLIPNNDLEPKNYVIFLNEIL